MNRHCLPFLAIVMFFCPRATHAQIDVGPAVDPGVKVNGAYTGNDIAKIDLATGNLTVKIPLVSFPQIGKLPPLSFTANLSGDSFTQVETCDPDLDQCWIYYARPQLGFNSNIGPTFNSDMSGGRASDFAHTWIAYWLGSEGGGEAGTDDCDPSTQPTTSQSGGGTPGDTSTCPEYLIVDSPEYDGEYSFTASLQTPVQEGAVSYGFVDPDGENHVMAADSSNWSTFRTTDGSGYTFVTTPNLYLYDAWVAANYYSPPGTIYGPTGLSFISSTAGNNYLGLTTISDPMGNKITRTGWNDWGTSQFIDSIGRGIPDISSEYYQTPTPNGPYNSEDVSKCPNLGDPNQPAEFTESWTVPGLNGQTETYLICFTYVQYLTGFWGTGISPYGVGGAADVWPNVLYQTTNGAPPTYGEAYDVFQVNTWDSVPPIQSIVLPNGTYWGFLYDAGCLSCDLVSASASSTPPPSTYGDITQIYYPTGATESFQYENVERFGEGPIGVIHNRSVKSITVNDAAGHTWTRSFDYSSIVAGNNPATTAGVVDYSTTEHNPTEDQFGGISDTVHFFSNYGADPSLGSPSFYEYEADTYAGSYGSSPLLKSVRTTYQAQPEILVQATFTGQYRATNVLPTSITTSTPIGIQSVVTKSYQPIFTAVNVVCPETIEPTSAPPCFPGQIANVGPTNVSYNVPTTETVYDGANNTLSQTVTTPEFVTNPVYYNANFLALPASVQVYGQPCNIGTWGNSCTLAAQTTYGYDASSGVIQGEQTSVNKFVNLGTGSQTISSSTSYLSNGMPYLYKDWNGNQTWVGYASGCNGLFPQTVIHAYQSQTTVPETATYSYDCNTGYLQSSVSPAGIATQYVFGTTPATSYLNPVYSYRLLTEIKKAFGVTGVENWTQYGYPNATEIDVAQDQNSKGDGLITSKQILDGLLRPIEAVAPNGAMTVTQYNAEGEVDSITNPYQSVTDATYGVTYFTYDALGRKTVQKQQDGNRLQWCYDGLQTTGQTNCQGNVSGLGGMEWVDQADESGNDAQSVTDALGRLRSLVEPGTLRTIYGYDALGNLNAVSQAGKSTDTARNRSFTYDSLSRLICASNPEISNQQSPADPCPSNASTAMPSGVILYAYDFNGNLKSKSDPRGVTISYQYDGLDRLLSKYYAGDPTATASSCYQYDSATLGTGLLAAEWTQSGACPFPSVLPSSGYITSRHISAYDAMGREKAETQCTPANCTATVITPYTLHYDYNLTGNVTHAEDGIGQVVWLPQYDTSNHLSNVSAVTVWPTSLYPASLFAAQGYAPPGELTNWTSGTPATGAPALVGTRSYDNRLRPTAESVTGHD